MGHKLSLWIGALAVAAGTATAQVADGPFGEPSPEWLPELMQREAQKLKFKKVRFDDDVRSRLPGEITIGPSRANKTWHVGADIGGEYPVVCFVHAKEMNLANTVSAQAAFDIRSVSGEMGEQVSARKLDRIDAGAIDGSPYLGLEILYSIGSGDDASIGLIKVWAANRDGATLVCKHNEIGFRDSVFRLFEHFVRDFDNRNAPPRPYYDEVHVAATGGRPVGILRMRFTRDDDGYTKVETDSSTLRAVGDGDVLASDRYDLMWAEAGGELINGYSTSTTDGSEERSLTLVNEEDGWTLKGTLGGEDLEEALDAITAPLTPLGWYRLIRDAMTGESTDPVSFTMWAPGAAPETLTDATFERDGDTGGTLDAGPVTTRVAVDNDGFIREARTARDDTEVVFTRVWRKGNPYRVGLNPFRAQKSVAD